MSGLRDVVFLIVLIGLVPVSLIRPWLGILAWYWIAFMVPHGLTWGFGRTLPVAMLIGGAALVGWVFTKDRKPIPRTWTVFALLLLAAHFTLTTMLAYNPQEAWGKWVWVSKVLLMTFVTMTLFQERARLRWLYMVTALGLGFYGLKGGVWVLRTGGGERVFGPDMSFFADNNTLGLALCMILPMLLYLSREEPRPWLKKVLRVTFFFTIIAIVFTYSRGAFLGLVIILAVLIWRSPWRLRFGIVLLIGALVAAPFLPDRLWERIQSIGEQESAATRDTSVQGRFEAWRTAWNIALDHPFAGGGFRALWNEDIWNIYYGSDFLAVRDTHSLYFEVLSEHGFLGFGLYLLVLAGTLVTLRRIRKRWRGHAEYGYLANYAEMTQLCLYPYMIAGAFITVAYFDLYFYFVASSVMLRALSNEAEKALVPAPVPARRGRTTVASALALPARAPRRPLPSPRPLPSRKRHA
ncbi:MAG: putative O-glycosylation ligase, exosortase A system-associated [Candidatus Rokubacteria bacterium]|nr:putative O-glycosylation ligase, exosortase A system-associated [Candidatus Rokubacteria bacterium]